MAKRKGQKGSELPSDPVKAATDEQPEAEVVNIQDAGVLLSVNRFCDEAHCDNATIARRIKVANIQPVSKNARENRYRLADLLQCAYLLDDEGNLNPAGLDPFKRKAHYQAATEEVRYRAECGEFISKIQFEREYANAMKCFAQFRDTLPDILERDCGLTPAQISIVQTRLDQTSDDFHRALNSGDDQANASDQSSAG
jgi:hypothetical protein